MFFLFVRTIQLFLFSAMYEAGPVTLNTNELQDYLWVTRNELAEYLDPSLHAVAMGAIPPDFTTFEL